MKSGAEPPPGFAADWCFFLDVDGTLIEIAERPDAVLVEPSLIELLVDLKRAANGALALVSGRSLAELDRLFAPLRPCGAGQHGAERRDAAGTLHARPCRTQLLESIAARLQAFTGAHAGLLLEDKGCNLALHYRLAPQLEDQARAAMADALAALGDGYVLQPGKMVLEIRSTTYDKGTVIGEFMQEAPFRGRTPVFIGDDTTDEHGFAVVNALGGHSFKVGPGKTEARWNIDSVAMVRTWLAGWIAHAGARPTP